MGKRGVITCEHWPVLNADDFICQIDRPVADVIELEAGVKHMNDICPEKQPGIIYLESAKEEA